MMSIFRGPGILLNPLSVAQPVYLPQLFDRALASSGTNHCAVNDELGAIAHALHERGKPDQGNQLFGILESGYTLLDQRDNILECIQCTTPQILTRALVRSGRYFRDHEKSSYESRLQKMVSDEEMVTAAPTEHGEHALAAIILGVTPQVIATRLRQAAEDSALDAYKNAFKAEDTQKVSDEEIATALTEHSTHAAAARALGIVPRVISTRIRRAADDSILGAFKGVSKPGSTQKVSDDEIAAALEKHGTQTAAAKTLRVSPSVISMRITETAEGSVLAAFKGTFIHKMSDDEIAAALEKHDSQAAAAKTLGVTKEAISMRITKAAEDSPLHAFKGVFKAGATQKLSDDEIAAALEKHGSQAAAAKALGVAPSAISYRIRWAAEDSALAVFKGRFTRGRPTINVSDEEIAAALEKHGSQTAAAKALGISPSAISMRVRQAAEGSALGVFKEAFKNGSKKRNE